MTRIKDIKVWKENLDNTKPYTIAYKTTDEVHSAFVEITLENGITGIGAGNPGEYVTGENLEGTMSALHEENIQFLIGRDIRNINELTAKVVRKLWKNPAARAAIDIALYDAFTKHLDVPLVKYLGQKIMLLPTSNTIGIMNVEETLKEAENYGKRGFSVLKVKLGIDIDEDIERMVKLREKFGNRFTIRIDANQGYDTAKTIKFYENTKHLNIELIEQPLPAKAVEEMRLLPEEIRKVLAADESLISPQDAFDLLIPVQASGIYNIKFMKCGGVSQALRIADIAQLGKVDLFWGCNEESIVSITAALHTAFACANTQYIDLDGSLDLGRDVVKGGFILKDGVMYCSDKPGLGVERV